MNQFSKYLSVVILTSSSLIACSKDGGGGAQVSPGAVAISVAPATLKAERHRPDQCPRGIQGTWSARNRDRSVTRSSYGFQGEGLIRTEEAQGSHPTNQMIYDGLVREMTPNQEMLQGGARLWYVGACRRQKLVVKLHATGPRGILEKREETIARRNRLETRAIIESGGYTMPSEYFAVRSF